MKEKKIFLIPNAGGSHTLFHVFKKYLNDDIEVIILELPGRGKRIREQFLNNMNEAVSDLYNIICLNLNKYCKYAIFGYSMGCKIAYELSKKIIENGQISPVHMFFAARYPPHIKKDFFDINSVTWENFIEIIKKWEGLPEEILNHKDMRDFFFNIIWNDLKILYSSDNTDNEFKFNCDLSVFGGKYDKLVTFEDLASWKQYTDKNCTIYQYDDGHFFINKFAEDICKIINKIYI